MNNQVDTEKNIYEQWARQIDYYRQHLDVFICDYLKVPLKPIQCVVAREFGQTTTLCVVKSRGFGKTWLMAICCIAMCMLYPGTLVAVLSNTLEQAGQLLDKIDKYFAELPDIKCEIKATGGGKLISVNRSKKKCEFLNGSQIETYTMSSLRGNRAKIVVIDETPFVSQDDLEKIVSPVKNYKRTTCVQTGIKDYSSKTVSITSACLKSNPFFESFMQSFNEMQAGSTEFYACALDFNAAVHAGITDMEFFEQERKKLSQVAFDMEYGSRFLGAEEGSALPYEITEPCRVQTDVECFMPKNSKTEYVIGIDLATSGRKSADNAVISVIKIVEVNNGSYKKKLVFLKSYHGKKLDYLAYELRMLLVLFPNVIKVIFDQRGLGDSFPQFLNEPWICPTTGKEYPALCCDDDEDIPSDNFLPLLRSVKATAIVNQELITAMRVGFEKQLIELPISSKSIYGNKIVLDSDDENEKANKKQTTEEYAVFLETDALQVEMGNIVGKPSNNTVQYDTAKPFQHKDRYSSVSMAMRYIAEIEEEHVKEFLRKGHGLAIGSMSRRF